MNVRARQAQGNSMFDLLNQIYTRPAPFSRYTADTLWNDPHISKHMLAFHLNPDLEPASRNRGFIDRSAQWLNRQLDIGPGRSVADFGCGPGLYAERFARQGAAVTGIDISERSIAHARKTAAAQGLDITYTYQNYLDFRPDQAFDIITLIYCDFCALAPGQRSQLLQIFHNHLTPGGALFLNVFSLTAFDERKEEARLARNLMDGFWAPTPYFGFQNTFKYPGEKVVLDRYTIVEGKGTREVFNWLQYYDPASLEAELSASGFDITAWFGDAAGAPFEEVSDTIAVVAVKTG